MSSQTTVLRNTTTEDTATKKELKFLWLELTRKCNLECVHCYENSSPRLPLLGSMTTQNWIRVLEQASEMGIEMVQFIGGEPTLFPDLSQLIEVATRLNIAVEIYTNGTMIKDHLWSVFVENKVSLAFSYYSTDPEQHDDVTTKKGSHKKTRNAIKHAVALGLRVRVGVIQMPEISDESIQSTIAELKAIGVQNVGSDRMRGIGRGVVKLSAKRNPFGELCGGCGDGKMAIDNNGNVYPCVFSKFSSLGHVSHGLQSISNGSRLHMFREKMHVEHPKTKEEAKPCFPRYCLPYERCNPNTGCGPDGCSP